MPTQTYRPLTIKACHFESVRRDPRSACAQSILQQEICVYLQTTRATQRQSNRRHQSAISSPPPPPSGVHQYCVRVFVVGSFLLIRPTCATVYTGPSLNRPPGRVIAAIASRTFSS